MIVLGLKLTEIGKSRTVAAHARSRGPKAEEKTAPSASLGVSTHLWLCHLGWDKNGPTISDQSLLKIPLDIRHVTHSLGRGYVPYYLSTTD